MSIDQLRDCIGADAMERLQALAGGTVVRVPKSPPMSGVLAVLTAEEQTALARWAGGTDIYVPRGAASIRARRNAEILAARKMGHPVADIARRFGVTDRWVYQIIRRGRACA